MKLSSLIATLSCTGVMAVCSLGVSAETSLKGQNKNRMSATPNELATSRNQYFKQHNLSANNSPNKPKNVGYSVFSFAKDKEITLDNIGQKPALEDVEWYIEQY